MVSINEAFEGFRKEDLTGTFPRQNLRVIFEDALTGINEIDFPKLLDGFIFENLKFEMQEARGNIDITSMKLNKEIFYLLIRNAQFLKLQTFTF